MEIMNAEQQPEPRESSGTVVTMPRREPQPSPNGRQTVPATTEAEPDDEPGYGHGV
jgi:hypothetical protein